MCNCLVCERIQMIKENNNPYFVKELETGYVFWVITNTSRAIHCFFIKNM